MTGAWSSGTQTPATACRRWGATQIGEIKKKNLIFLPCLSCFVLTHRNRRVWSVAWSPDGTKVASGSEDNTVKIWETSTGTFQSTLRGHSDWWDFFFSSNFLPLPEFLRVLNHLIENGRVRSVAWSPDGNCIASGSDDKTIKVWNTKTGQCQSTRGHSDWWD
jgi:WD40 repeat protein